MRLRDVTSGMHLPLPGCVAPSRFLLFYRSFSFFFFFRSLASSQEEREQQQDGVVDKAAQIAVELQSHGEPTKKQNGRETFLLSSTAFRNEGSIIAAGTALQD